LHKFKRIQYEIQNNGRFCFLNVQPLRGWGREGGVDYPGLRPGSSQFKPFGLKNNSELKTQ